MSKIFIILGKLLDGKINLLQCKWLVAKHKEEH